MAAGGETTNSGIAHAAGIGDRALHYYLTTLMELGYVRRRHPLHGRPATSRETRYAIADSLLRFWFRFVYPNQSRILLLGPDRAVRELVRPAWDAYCGECFERLCREALPHLYLSEGMSAPFEVGEYWGKEVQIDVIGLREDGWADLGECKLGTVRSPGNLRNELTSKTAHFPNPHARTLSLRYFTRDPIKPPAAPSALTEHWHSLSTLYGDK